MKKFLLIIGFTALCNFAFSQNFKLLDSNYIYIGLSGGTAFPFGDFHSSDINVNAAGYAKPGSFFSLKVDYKFFNYLGASVSVLGSVNSTYSEELAENTAAQHPGNYATHTESWKTGGIMAGLFGVYPIDKDGKFSVELRAQYGVLNVTTPYIRLSNLSTGVVSEEKKQFAYSGAILTGAGLNYKLTENFLITANCSFLYSNPHFNNLEYLSNSVIIDHKSFNQEMKEIVALVGLTYKLK